MMQEIYQRGPIACGVAVPAALENYTSGIFDDKTGDTNIVHDISVVGWGVEKGVKYWTVRNSWGSHFGELGFFRVIRGVNNIAIESDCSWATPLDTWTKDERHHLTPAEKAEPVDASLIKCQNIMYSSDQQKEHAEFKKLSSKVGRDHQLRWLGMRLMKLLYQTTGTGEM